MSDSVPVRRSGRLAKFAGLGIAGMGLSHLTSPGWWEPITRPAFPRNTRTHVYANGGIETVLGLGLVNRRTRSLAVIGGVGYLAYLGSNAVRSGR